MNLLFLSLGYVQGVAVPLYCSICKLITRNLICTKNIYVFACALL